MRILFPYLARARAANWSRYQQLLIARARAGDEVTVLEPPTRRSAETNFRDVHADFPRGFHVEEVPVWPPFWNTRLPFDKILKKGAYSVAANRRVREIVGRSAPDALLVYNITHEPLLDVPVPTVFDVADDLPSMLREEGGPAGVLLESIARRALTRMIRRASLVTTPSRVLLPSLGPGAVFVPNGVDPDEIAAARDAAGNAGGEAARNAPIGFLGSFEYFVDFELVWELAGRLPARKFVLIGGGRRFGDARARIERDRLGNVELSGPLPHPEALARLAGCAVSLCPFRRDPVGHAASPLKLFESLALGVPVVATRTREIEAEGPPNVRFADSAVEAAAVISDLEAERAETRRAANESAAEETLRSRAWDRIGAAWAGRVAALPNPAIHR